MNSYNKYTDLQINELVATRLKKKCLLTEESVLAYMDSGYRIGLSTHAIIQPTPCRLLLRIK